MTLRDPIPVFTLFGEQGAFPDVIHCERIWDRARLHDWVISPHRHHEMAQVFFMRQGAATVVLDGRSGRMLDGDFLFVPAGVVHGFSFRKGCEGLVLSFPAAVMAGLARASVPLARVLRRSFIGQVPAFGVALMDRLAEEFARPGPLRATRLVALSHALFAELAEAQGGQGAPDTPSDRRMRDFDQLIQQHMGRGWGVSDHAQALGITTGHLNRICQASTGQSASRHLETARMTEAARLLAFTRLGAAEIGYRLGYEDPSYFSRRFRAVRGETPSAYRKRVAG